MTAPNWPDRHSSGPLVSGDVVDIDAATGRVRLRGPDGETTIAVPADSLEGLHKGDRVNIQSIPAGRSASAIGGAAADDPPRSRLLPELPPARPNVGQAVPPAPPPPEPVPAPPAAPTLPVIEPRP
jgi:hypothetical protein